MCDYSGTDGFSSYELDSLTRKIMRLEIERQAIKKEKDPLSLKRKEEIDKELTELKVQEKDLKISGKQKKIE